MDDLAVRPARLDDCYALARLVVNGNESSFRGRVPDACLDGLPVEMSARNWRRNFVDGLTEELMYGWDDLARLTEHA